MKLVGRLAGNQMQRLRISAGSRPFAWLHPGRMRGKIGIAKPGDALRINLDPSARCGKRVGYRVAAKFSHHVERRIGRSDPVPAFAEQFVIGWQPGVGGRLAALVIYPSQPAFSIAPFGKLRFEAHFPADPGKDIMVVTGGTRRLHGLFHGNDIRIAGRHRQIASVKRDGAGKYDISVFYYRVPAPHMDNDGVGLAPGLFQPGKILMMAKRVSPGPIDKPYIMAASAIPAQNGCAP